MDFENATVINCGKIIDSPDVRHMLDLSRKFRRAVDASNFELAAIINEQAASHNVEFSVDSAVRGTKWHAVGGGPCLFKVFESQN